MSEAANYLADVARDELGLFDEDAAEALAEAITIIADGDAVVLEIANEIIANG